EPAPAPPPAKSEPAPTAPRAPVAKIADFAGAETDNQVTVAMKWDDYDANDGGGMPTGDANGIDMGGTDRPEAGRPSKGKKTTVNVEGTEAAPDPDAHLDAVVATTEGDEATVDADGNAEPAPVKPSASERRRMAMEALSREQATRAIETNLIAERSKREDLEKKLKNATLGELLAMRGIDR